MPDTPEQLWARAHAALASPPQLIGSPAAIWDDVLPPLPEETWRENLALARAALDV